MDFITTTEHLNFNRWISTTYNISNANRRTLAWNCYLI